MAELLANVPWWLLISLAVAAAVMLIHGNRTINTKWRAAGVATISLLLLLTAARFLIDTPAEKAERQTRQIVNCVNTGNWGQLQALIEPGTAAEFDGVRPDANGGDAIIHAAEVAAKAVGLTSVGIYTLRTEQTNDLVTVTFVAYSMQDQSQGRAVVSDWQFDWRVREHQPHLTKITLLNLGNQS